MIDQAIVDEPPANLQSIGIIKPGYSSELDQVIEASKHAREWIAGLETVEKESDRDKNSQGGFQ